MDRSLTLKATVRFLPKRITPFAGLALLLIAVAVTRLVIAFVLIDTDAMWSVDGGTYLINRDEWLGIEHDVVMHARPPFAPGIALYPFTLALGDNFGLRLWSCVGSLLLVVASYYFASGFFSKGQAVAVAAVVSADFWLLENMGAGAIVLYAMALLCVVLRGVVDWVYDQLNNWRLVAMAASLGLLPYVNQTMTGLALLVLPALFLAGLYLRYRDGIHWRALVPARYMAAIVGGIILAIPSLQWYLPVAPGGDTTAFGGPFVRFGPGLYFEWFIWAAWMLVLWVAYPLMKERWGLLCWVVLAAMACLMPLYSHDEVVLNFVWRSKYLASLVGAVLLLGVVSRVWHSWKGGLSLIMLHVGVSTLVLLSWGTGISSFSAFGRDDMAATEWLMEQDNTAPVVVDGWSRARTVSALTNRKVYTMRFWGFPRLDVHALPEAFRNEQIASFCVAGWETYLLNGDCNDIDVPPRAYILANTELTRGEHIPSRYTHLYDDSVESMAALSDTRVVWQRGEVYIWELDREAAREFDVDAHR